MRGHGFLLANYVPGNSFIHRWPLALKFLLVFACSLASFLVVDWRVSLAVLAALCCLLLLAVMLATYGIGKWMGLPREDAIVLLFCGSKKSLASGVPMAGVLFPAAQVGAIILPLMLFHQIQLIACAVIARRYADRATAETAAVPPMVIV